MHSKLIDIKCVDHFSTWKVLDPQIVQRINKAVNLLMYLGDEPELTIVQEQCCL